MKFLDQYDWIVLGDHPAALLSAGLAGRLGLSVLVLPLAPGARLRVSGSGQHLDPESSFLPGLARSGRAAGLIQECLKKLGIAGPETEMIQMSGALPQAATPDFRLALARDDEELEREFKRELGARDAVALGLKDAVADADIEFQRYWLGLPDRLTIQAGQKKKRTIQASLSLSEVKRKLERAGKGRGAGGKSWFSGHVPASAHARALGRAGITELCSALWFGTAGAAAEDPASDRLSHAMAVARTGARYVGGMSAYRELLLRLAQRHGAHVSLRSECRRVFVNDGRFVGVQVSQKGSMIGAGGGILGCSLSHAAERVAAEGRSWLRKLKPAPEPAGWRFTLAISVAEEAIPPGMSRRLVWKEPEAPALEIELADSAEYGASEPGVKIVFVRTILPFSQESLSPEYQRVIAARMMRQLSELMPFVEFHVRRIYPDFRRPLEDGGRAELSEAYGFAMPAMIPENLRCFSGEAPGVGARSGVDGLFVSTGESFPELGTMGATVAAIEAVSWAAHRAGLAGPLV